MKMLRLMLISMFIVQAANATEVVVVNEPITENPLELDLPTEEVSDSVVGHVEWDDDSTNQKT